MHLILGSHAYSFDGRSGQRPVPLLLERPGATSPRPELEMAFSNPVNQFNFREGDCSGPKEFESQHRMTSLLDRSVILFDDVVQVLTGSNQDKLPLRVFAPQ